MSIRQRDRRHQRQQRQQQGPKQRKQHNSAGRKLQLDRRELDEPRSTGKNGWLSPEEMQMLMLNVQDSTDTL